MTPNGKPLVLGVGGAGGNFLNHLAATRVETELTSALVLAAANTDAQALNRTNVPIRILLGADGLGAGAKPERGAAAARATQTELAALINSHSPIILVGGLGGGTGSGAMPVITQLARAKGADVVVLGTLPFEFEGKRRAAVATAVALEMRQLASATCYFPNQLLLESIGHRDLTQQAAFAAVNELLVAALYRVAFPNQSSSRLRETLARIAHFADWSSVLQCFEDWEAQLRLVYPRKSSASPHLAIGLHTEAELLQLVRQPASVHSISPRRFEELMHALYRAAGLRAELTKQSGDDGADLLVWTPGSLFGQEFLTVVQVKRYTGRMKVGSPAIRELKGTQILFDAQRSECVTTTNFTRSARKTAETLKVDLAEFSQLCTQIDKIIRS